MKYSIILFLFCTEVLTAQVNLIRGRIISDIDKSQINYVSIYVEGKNLGTASDENGNFELKGNFSDDDIIVFSHVSYETKKVSAAELINIIFNTIILQNKIITSQTILVKGSIGQAGITPLTFSKISQKEIKQIYINQDIPELLSYQPSITFYSENGNGLGYNYLSIRGFDQRRISVSINGIPQNDPEDHNVYWLDFPDLIKSTELIQVQRGAGSGIIGYPAIGGSINIITSTFSDKPRFEFSSLLGDYNTRKYSLQYSSGLISKKYSFYTKVSQTLSSGYRKSSWINFTSYHFSAVRYDDNLTTQINIYGGPIADGLAYTGLPKFALKQKELRKANYSYWEADDKNYTYTLDRRPDEIENFSQPHFELLNEIGFNDNIIFNNALFLVLGNGFFDYDGSWSNYYDDYFRLKANGFDPNKIPTNALIRAQVENKQWGWIPRLSIKHDNGELILGGELRIHRSVHWGSINYAENLPEGVTKDYRYYYYEGGKNIYNLYANENYKINENVNLLLEAQFAYHRYELSNEKYLGYNFAIDNIFFNPRIGLNYKINSNWNIYWNYAKVSREPTLKNYYDAAESSDGKTIPQFEINSLGRYDFIKPLVHPETMNDIEFGTWYSNGNINLSLNAFYMLFNNEIVKRGQVDRFGQPITGNMDRTIHYGVEAAGSINLYNEFEFVFNGSVSKNYISNGTAFINYTGRADGLEKTAQVDLSGNSISGFPDITLNAIIKFKCGKLFAQASLKYVGHFYSDNYFNRLSELISNYPGIADYSDNVIDAYSVANLFVSYNISIEPDVIEVKIFFQLNNLFDSMYASYGIGKEFFPAADRNILFGIKFGLE